LYIKWSANRVLVETNSGWEYFATELKDLWIATDAVRANKDKVSRLKEHEASFERWEVYFSKNCENLVDQLIWFTWEDWNTDDLVDWMVHSFGKKKRQLVSFST
jgi:phage terminase large subunit-like protein